MKSSRSGARWLPPGSAPWTRTRRSGSAERVGADPDVVERAGDDGECAAADEGAVAVRGGVEESPVVGSADSEHEPDDHQDHEERLHRLPPVAPTRPARWDSR